MKRIVMISLALAFVVNVAVAAEKAFTPDQTKQIETIIKSYLIKNPEVLIEAGTALQKKEQELQQQQAKKAIDANKAGLFNGKSPIAGNPNGDVFVVEFFDYQCSHCKRMISVVDGVISSDKNVRVVFKEFPIFGANSTLASKAALASQKQGKYKEFHTALMQTKAKLNEDKIMEVAKKVGLDTKQLKKDMQDPAYEAELAKNRKLGDALGIRGTPAFVVASSNKKGNPVFIPGATSLDALKKRIKTIRGTNGS